MARLSRRLRLGESPRLDRRAAATAALDIGLPRGETLAAVAAETGMSVSGLSRLARRLGFRGLPTGRAAGKKLLKGR